MEGKYEVSVTHGDCVALDAQKYKAYKWDGAKIEPPNKEPHALACFISSAKQQITLYCMLYGWEHKDERRGALKQLDQFQERKPDLPTVPFLVSRWGRLRYEYTESIREGVRTLIMMLPKGAGRDALVMLALSPRKKTNKRARRRSNVFSFEAKSGMWRGRILPELEDQLESSRISGSAQMRNPPAVGGNPVHPIRNNERAKKERRSHTGGPPRALDPPAVQPQSTPSFPESSSWTPFFSSWEAITGCGWVGG